MASTETGINMIHIAAIAYPGCGHIIAMMNFFRILSNRGGFRISFVVTEEWHSILSSDPPPPPCVQLCTIPNCIPSERDRVADLNAFLEAVWTKMEEPFERLIMERLQPPVQAILSDTSLHWIIAVGNRSGIPVCSLFPMAATFFHALNNYDVPNELTLIPRRRNRFRTTRFGELDPTCRFGERQISFLASRL